MSSAGLRRVHQRLRGLMRLAQVVRSMPMEPVSPTFATTSAAGRPSRAAATSAESDWLGIGASLGTGRPGGIDRRLGAGRVPSWRAGTTQPRPVPSRPVLDSPPAPAVGAAWPRRPRRQARVPATARDAACMRSGPTGGLAIRRSRLIASRPWCRRRSPACIARTIRYAISWARRAGSRTVTLLEQSFQGGLAIWRSDTRQIYVLRRDGNTWSAHSDTWQPATGSRSTCHRLRGFGPGRWVWVRLAQHARDPESARLGRLRAARLRRLDSDLRAWLGRLDAPRPALRPVQ